MPDEKFKIDERSPSVAAFSRIKQPPAVTTLQGLDSTTPEALDWYEPLVKYREVLAYLNQSALHGRCINLIVDLLTGCMRPAEGARFKDVGGFGKFWPRRQRRRFMRHVYVLGDGYLLKRKDKRGDVIGLQHRHTMLMRRGVDRETYYEMTDPDGAQWRLRFKKGVIVHVYEDTPYSTIYGCPRYLAGLRKVALELSLDNFATRFFNNNTGLGMLLLLDHDWGDWQQDPDTKKMYSPKQRALLKFMQETKGDGNFDSLMINLNDPNTASMSTRLMSGERGPTLDDRFKLQQIKPTLDRIPYNDMMDAVARGVLSAHGVMGELVGYVANGAKQSLDLYKVLINFVATTLNGLAEDIVEGINDELGPEHQLQVDWEFAVRWAARAQTPAGETPDPPAADPE